MAYIGQEPGQGQAERFIYTATGTGTSVTADDNGVSIGYTVGQVSVYLNGVKQVLGAGKDVTATDGSTITFLSSYSASDVIEVIALSAFQPSDTVSASGGTFTGNVTLGASDATYANNKALKAYVGTTLTDIIPGDGTAQALGTGDSPTFAGLDAPGTILAVHTMTYAYYLNNGGSSAFRATGNYFSFTTNANTNKIALYVGVNTNTYAESGTSSTAEARLAFHNTISTGSSNTGTQIGTDMKSRLYRPSQSGRIDLYASSSFGGYETVSGSTAYIIQVFTKYDNNYAELVGSSGFLLELKV